MITPDRDKADRNRAVHWRPGKRWSLWDMMNFELLSLYHLLFLLRHFERDAAEQPPPQTTSKSPFSLADLGKTMGVEQPSDAVSQETKETVEGAVNWAKIVCGRLEMAAVLDRADSFLAKMKYWMPEKILRRKFERCEKPSNSE